MKRISDKKPKNLKLNSKKSIIIFIIILVLILLGIFLISKALPVEDVTSKDIKISFSTSKVTGKNLDINIASTKNYDIYYYIDYLDENDYYDEILEVEGEAKLEKNNTLSNSVENSTNSTKSQNNTNNMQNFTNTTNSVKNETISKDKKIKEVKSIENNQYKKMTSSTITVENNATIYLKYGKFKKLSSNPYTFEVNNIDKTGPEIEDIRTNSTDSSIRVTVSAIDLQNPNLTYYFKLEDDEEYICTETDNYHTFKNLTKDQTYSIYVKVTDGFGNESEAVTDAIASSQASQSTTVKKVYHIKVNLGANTVTVYDKGTDGKASEPIKAMVCSVGKATPKSGTYKISVRYRWRELFGNVYGQYAVRITGNILFHSVPYLNMYPDTLEYEEYDKLGTSASAGCVRLTVEDAKWIYDNAANGTTVEFYSDKDNPGPLGKPTAQKISGNKAKRNWDPTDPDARNPWHGGNGVVTKVERPATPANTTNKNTNTATSNVSNNISNTTNNTDNRVIFGTDD